MDSNYFKLILMDFSNKYLILQLIANMWKNVPNLTEQNYFYKPNSNFLEMACSGNSPLFEKFEK